MDERRQRGSDFAASVKPGRTMNFKDWNEAHQHGSNALEHADAFWAFQKENGHKLAAERKTQTKAIAIAATPFSSLDASTIPPRRFVYGRHLIRQFVSTTFAPGGVGKSSLGFAEALAMASGRPLLGVEPAGRLRVWIWNGEDPFEELQRR